MQFIILTLFKLLLALAFCSAQFDPILIVHGGAGDIGPDREDGKYRGMKASIRRGFEILKETDNVLDAIEAAIIIMEDLSDFNAGCGSALTGTNEVEMDAVIINGTDLSAGSVGAVRHIKNPISLARKIKDNTPHVLLVGQGAEDYAQSIGFELIPTSDLIPKHRQKFKTGTVGAVAINSKGQIGTGTSTGGLTGKLNGRVGDAPIIGAGSFAEDSIGGISATGHGEGFLRYRVASRVAELLQKGDMSPSEAAEQILKEMTERFPEMDGGLIVIAKNGTSGIPGYAFNSNQLAWAYGQGDLIHFGINHNEHFTEPIDNPNPDLPFQNATCSSNGAISSIILNNKYLFIIILIAFFADL